MNQEYIEILLEEMNGKFDLVLEGHQVLNNEITRLRSETSERCDLVDLKFTALNTKIDNVAADLKARDERLTSQINSVENNLTQKIDKVAVDLKAHRQDTESHHGLYKVKE